MQRQLTPNNLPMMGTTIPDCPYCGRDMKYYITGVGLPTLDNADEHILECLSCQVFVTSPTSLLGCVQRLRRKYSGIMMIP